MSGRPKDIPQVSGDTRDSSETAIGLFHFTYTNRHSHSQLSGTLDARNSFVKMTGCRWDISVKPGWSIRMDFNIFDEVDNFGWRESPVLVRFIFNIYKIMRIDHCHIDVINFFFMRYSYFFPNSILPIAPFLNRRGPVTHPCYWLETALEQSWPHSAVKIILLFSSLQAMKSLLERSLCQLEVFS